MVCWVCGLLTCLVLLCLVRLFCECGVLLGCNYGFGVGVFRAVCSWLFFWDFKLFLNCFISLVVMLRLSAFKLVRLQAFSDLIGCFCFELWALVVRFGLCNIDSRVSVVAGLCSWFRVGVFRYFVFASWVALGVACRCLLGFLLFAAIFGFV